MSAVMKTEREPHRGPTMANGLTEKQNSFVQYLVSGVPQGKAAKLAGYVSPDQSAYRLVRDPGVQEAIRAESAKVLMSDGVPNALAFMVKAPLNEKLPGAVRFQAAKWVLENAGHGLAAQRAQLGLPDFDKPLSEMSVAELDQFLSAGFKALEANKAQEQRTIEGSARNIESDGVGGEAQVIDA